MTSTPTIEISLTAWDDPPSIHLRAAQRAEIEQTYSRPSYSAPSADDIPVFIVLKVDGVAVACGGLRPLQGSQAAEIKRMFVLPEYRGTAFKLSGEGSISLASLLLQELEAQAVKRGWHTLKLGTGTGMAAARSFYERNGFCCAPLFGHYVDAPDSVCYEKVLGVGGSVDC